MSINSYKFYCSACSHCLSNDDKITLKTVRHNGDIGVIHMNVSIGDYTYEHEPPLEFENGELVHFHCPDCNHQMQSEQYEKFATIIMKVDDKIEFELLFSREAGRRKTYIITEDGIESYSRK